MLHDDENQPCRDESISASHARELHLVAGNDNKCLASSGSMSLVGQSEDTFLLDDGSKTTNNVQPTAWNVTNAMLRAWASETAQWDDNTTKAGGLASGNVH